MTIDMVSTIAVDVLDLDAIAAGGVTAAFDTIDGWHDGPGVNVEQVQRIISHGQFAQPGHRTGRVVTVGGWMTSETRAQMFDAVQSLASVLADGGFATMTVTDEDGPTLTASVQLLDKPDVRWDQHTFCRFQLSFLAPEPYKYGAAASDTAAIGAGPSPTGVGLRFPLFTSPNEDSLDFGGSVTPPDPPGIATISNPGTADASVLLTVAGPTPAEGFSMTDFDTNLSITYVGSAIPDGSQIVFNGSDGSVLSDGSDVSGFAIVEAWPIVPAGGDLTILFQSLGEATDAELTVSANATYW